MPYDIYLLTYPLPPNRFNGSKAHWGIYIPNHPTPNLPQPTQETEDAVHHIGKVIHVTGTPFTGYGREFKRNYHLASTGRGWKKYPLAVVDDKHVSIRSGDDDDDGGKFSVDVTPRDELERQAMRVDPPGPSKEPLNPAVGKRCQEWIRDYVSWLIERKILTDSAIQVLDDVKAIEQQQQQN
ncbi:predicted protein [Uncinocarpus reesii 1704]|uniref:Uncharacterized protein n=1 Tax=Uncinocarpus reesii (strain UAMH 1704) TaxID=336963 RepID=C4JG38_UNCRE|nr:uncharacterized protein UREG_01118 [Uncinocarpus reesii 1704]EEP76269.1 predicted protein [Uncinocarpus reesii 1704]